MSRPNQKQQAAQLLKELIDLEALPSSLRSPLNRVIDGDEMPGTAQGVLDYAREVLDRARLEQQGGADRE